jgi:hypothetical protein
MVSGATIISARSATSSPENNFFVRDIDTKKVFKEARGLAFVPQI